MSHFFAKLPVRWDMLVAPVRAHDFLAAAQGLVGIFDVMGALTLLPVKADMQQNIERMRPAAGSGTLAQFIDTEKAAGRTRGDCPLTSYVWLVRALEFVARAFQRWAERPAGELKMAFTDAYPATLRVHHTWMQRTAFSIAMGGVPTSAYLLQRLGHPPQADMAAYFSALTAVLRVIPKI